MEVKKVAEEWKIWDKEEEVARSEAEAKKLVPKQFHKWIKVFGKKQSKRMLTRKVWDHAIDVKECYETLWTLTFFFLLSIFLDFIFLFLLNFFFFFFKEQ